MKVCAQCGGKLVLIEEETLKIEGVGSSVTRREYKCLDAKCQEKMDKETASRIKLKEERTKKI